MPFQKFKKFPLNFPRRMKISLKRKNTNHRFTQIRVTYTNISLTYRRKMVTRLKIEWQYAEMNLSSVAFYIQRYISATANSKMKSGILQRENASIIYLSRP